MVESPDIESGGPLLARTAVIIDDIDSEVQITRFGLQYRSLIESGVSLRQPWITLPLAEVFCVKLHRNAIILHTFRRDSQKPSIWYPKYIVIDFGSKVSQKECMLKVVQDELDSMVHRPKRLLVFINPISGSKQALSKYKDYIEPFFKLGGISSDVIETKEFDQDASCQIAAVISGIRDNKVSYDGIIAVGGDGLCTKLVNVCVDTLYREGGGIISPIRLGHIPCGSTDALSSSLNGTRNIFTSMMHIVLGDHLNMDTLEISLGGGPTKRSLCIVTCGFMADVIRFSESMRVMGPFRYDIAGIIKLMQNKSYRCKVRYIEAKLGKEFDRLQCKTNCPRCMTVNHGGFCSNLSEAWREREPQDYMSIMILNTACISDKSKFGMYKYGHVSDGCGYLVMVKACSSLRYLAFLLSMSKFGLSIYDDQYVEIIPVHQVEIESSEPSPLYWNLDGELDMSNKISVATCVASVPVFARGIET